MMAVLGSAPLRGHCRVAPEAIGAFLAKTAPAATATAEVAV
ncbi:hypothetical protein ACF1BU_31445 [Streptomyces sp. NPDC014724]